MENQVAPGRLTVPFKSEAQHRKFRILLEQGKITQKQFDSWMKETKKIHGKEHPIKPLPERIKKASNKKKEFMDYYLKKSKEKDVAGDTPKSVNYPTTLSDTDSINNNAVKVASPRWDNRLINLAKRRDPRTKGVSDKEIGENLHKYSPFRKTAAPIFTTGFLKSAGGPGSGVAHDNTDTIDFLETSPLISIGYRQKFMDSHKPDETNIAIRTERIKYKGQEKLVPKKLVKMMKIWEEIKDKPIDVLLDNEGDYHIMDGHHRGLAAILMKKPYIRANIYHVPKELE